MTPLRHSVRRPAHRAVLLVALVSLSALVAACSSGTSRNASAADGYPTTASTIDTTGFSNPIGDPTKAINSNDWCLRPQDGDGDAGFRYVRNIVACQVMTNTTKRFTAPGVLNGILPLGVVKADCSQNDYTCRDVGGSWYGEVRTEGVWASNVTLKGDRYANPNPFLVKSAIQFMPKKIWQGVEIKTYVGANASPYSLDQSMATMYSEIPTTGKNTAACTSGAFVACTLVTPESDYKYGSQVQFEYRFSNRPVSIQIVNATGQPMKIVGSETGTAGSAFLPDPTASSGLSQIATGTSAYVGGYFGTSNDSSRYWQASYCIVTPNSGPCYQVNISISMVEKDGKLVDDSSCSVVAGDRTYSFRCDKPEYSADGVFYTVNVRS